METDELQYELPAELIAQHPADCRSDSKLLVFDRCNSSLADSRFSQIGRFLFEGDCLVLNDTKVIPARFFARRLSGGRIEGLFLAEPDCGIWEVMLKGAGKVKPAETIQITDTGKRIFCRAVVIKKSGRGFYRLKVDAGTDADGILEQIGYPPLPPYIKRDDDAVLAQKMAARLLEKGVYVIGFSFPVVPKGTARIRVQISAAHSREDLDFALQMFKEVKEEFDV